MAPSARCAHWRRAPRRGSGAVWRLVGRRRRGRLGAALPPRLPRCPTAIRAEASRHDETCWSQPRPASAHAATASLHRLIWSSTPSARPDSAAKRAARASWTVSSGPEGWKAMPGRVARVLTSRVRASRWVCTAVWSRSSDARSTRSAAARAPHTISSSTTRGSTAFTGSTRSTSSNAADRVVLSQQHLGHGRTRHHPMAAPRGRATARGPAARDRAPRRSRLGEPPALLREAGSSPRGWDCRSPPGLRARCPRPRSGPPRRAGRSPAWRPRTPVSPTPADHA